MCKNCENCGGMFNCPVTDAVFETPRDHHSYPVETIGFSDRAQLDILNEYSEFIDVLKFQEDGGYCAYIVDADCAIPGYYALVFESEDSVILESDDGWQFTVNSDNGVRIFRAGMRGCIIQTF